MPGTALTISGMSMSRFLPRSGAAEIPAPVESRSPEGNREAECIRGAECARDAGCARDAESVRDTKWLNVSMMRAQSRSFRASIMSSRLTSRSTTAIDTRVVHIVTTVANA